jgi:hypothetical protein
VVNLISGKRTRSGLNMKAMLDMLDTRTYEFFSPRLERHSISANDSKLGQRKNLSLLSRICGWIPVPAVVPGCDRGLFASL